MNTNPNTNLSNFSLLNDEVAHNLNAETLKQQRMNQVSQTANKPPVPENENNVIQMNPNNPNYQHQNQQPQNQQVVNENNENSEENFEGDEDAYSKYANKNNDSAKKENKSSDNKILGMKPIVFYGLLAVGLGVAGYFTYRHFKGKNNGKSLKAPSKAVSDVAESTAEVAKSATAPLAKVA